MIIRILAWILLDKVSKWIIIRYIDINSSIIVIKNFFNITHVKNTGAAFSIFSGKRDFLLIVSILVIGGLIWYLIKNKRVRRIERYGYELVLGGAIGNFVERLFLGYVTDFLDFRIFGYNYPIFNLADCFIVVGIVILIVDTWRERK